MPVNVGKWASGSFRQTSTGGDRIPRSWTGPCYGLAAIKHVGEHLATQLIQTRATGHLSFFDLCDRVDRRIVTKRVLDALIKSGALDALCDHRAQPSRILDDATPAKPTRSHRNVTHQTCSISCRRSQKIACCPNTNLVSIYSIGPRAKLSGAMSVTIPYASMTTN